jgi:rubredoxin
MGQNLARGDERNGVCRRSAAEDQCQIVFQRSITAAISRRAMVAMRRKLVWVERQNFQGWACTECAWVFNPSWPLVGNSIDEMKTNFGQQRDKEFASHVCAEHPRAS